MIRWQRKANGQNKEESDQGPIFSQFIRTFCCNLQTKSTKVLNPLPYLGYYDSMADTITNTEKPDPSNRELIDWVYNFNVLSDTHIRYKMKNFLIWCQLLIFRIAPLAISRMFTITSLSFRARLRNGLPEHLFRVQSRLGENFCRGFPIPLWHGLF